MKHFQLFFMVLSAVFISFITAAQSSNSSNKNQSGKGNANSSSSDYPFNKTPGPLTDKNVLLNVGLGVGSPYYYGGSSMTFPPLSASVEYMMSIPNDPLNGKLGIGGLIGVAGSRYYRDRYFYGPNGGYYEQRFTYYLMGVRVNYHFINQDKIDFYLGLMLGYRWWTYNFYTDIPNLPRGYVEPRRSAWLALGAHIGFRYFFTPKFALFSELGYNISWLTLGTTFKF